MKGEFSLFREVIMCVCRLIASAAEFIWDRVYGRNSFFAHQYVHVYADEEEGIMRRGGRIVLRRVNRSRYWDESE